MNLAEFLLARIAEDEALAQEALHPDAVKPGAWVTEHHNSEYHSEPDRAHIAEDRSGHYWSVAHEVFIPIAEHVARHDPAHVLAECEAKRRIVVRCEEMQTAAVPMAVHLATRTLADLATPHADHPDYRSEWAP